MRTTGQLIELATPFVWLGMVLSISFLETPLKYRAPASRFRSASAGSSSVHSTWPRSLSSACSR